MTTTIEKIHQFNAFGSRLGMERMNIILEKLGNPQQGLKAIHVAGTNGKGSVCKFLEGALSACGYRVGLYTSPFLERFHERIRLGGEEISDAALQQYGEQVLAAADEMVAEGYDSPTEFEVVTALAFLYFQQEAADIAILEVGLGGRGDSTNAVENPLICAICSVSYDHMERLGNTLEEIAADKAGIIKPGVPIVSNVPRGAAARVIARTAYRNGSRLYDVSGIDFTLSEETPVSQKVSMELYGTDYRDVELSMVGRHQGENLKTALAILEILRKEKKISVERSRLYAGLKQAVQPGRFEVVRDAVPEEGSPMVIVDGAHNEAGARALKETALTFFSDRKVLLVTGMLADKQVDEMLVQLTQITKDIVVTAPDNPRRLEPEELEAHVRKLGIEPRKAADAEQSIQIVRDIWADYDAVIVAGSLYLIGEIRRIMKHGERKKSR